MARRSVYPPSLTGEVSLGSSLGQSHGRFQRVGEFIDVPNHAEPLLMRHDLYDELLQVFIIQKDVLLGIAAGGHDNWGHLLLCASNSTLQVEELPLAVA